MITETVLNDFRQGKKEAYDQVYKSYAPGMFGICLRYTRCRDDAQDVLQESFIKVYLNREKFRKGESIGAWIKAITINTALTYIKQQYRFQLVENELKLDEIQVEADETPDYRSMQEKLLEILNRLPDGYRTVFNLFVVDNLTHQEIAEYLNISESTSKTQLFKAKKMIQAIIEKEKISYGT